VEQRTEREPFLSHDFARAAYARRLYRVRPRQIVTLSLSKDACHARFDKLSVTRRRVDKLSVTGQSEPREERRGRDLTAVGPVKRSTTRSIRS
jgi:hypothetical protein